MNRIDYLSLWMYQEEDGYVTFSLQCQVGVWWQFKATEISGEMRLSFCMGRAKSHLEVCSSRHRQKSHQGIYQTGGGAAAVITMCRSLLGDAVQFRTGTFLSKTPKLTTVCKTKSTWSYVFDLHLSNPILTPLEGA